MRRGGHSWGGRVQSQCGEEAVRFFRVRLAKWASEAGCASGAAAVDVTRATFANALDWA